MERWGLSVELDAEDEDGRIEVLEYSEYTADDYLEEKEDEDEEEDW